MQFLTDELKVCSSQNEAKERVYFVSAREALICRLQSAGVVPGTPGTPGIYSISHSKSRYNFKVMLVSVSVLFIIKTCCAHLCEGSVAEWSKALVLGTSLFGGVGSNPITAKTCFCLVGKLIGRL